MNPPNESLLSGIQAELQATRWHLGFEPALERRFEADEGQRRGRDLVVAGIVGVLAYDLFLINDWMVRPEVIGTAVFWRVGVLTLYAAAVLLLVHRGLGGRQREAAMASTVVVVMCCSCEIFRATQSAAAIYDPFAFPLIFVASSIALALRFVPALAGSVIAFAIAVIYVSGHPQMPLAARQFSLAMMAGTAMLSLLASYRLERTARRSYLLLLRETLQTETVRRQADAMTVLSQTDPLTGLANRRAFEEALERSWAGVRGTGRRLALVAIDIDHFKRLNDRLGHPAGDACLRRVAETIRRQVREGDLAARVGGEEFVVLLRRADSALQVAERIRTAVAGLGIDNGPRGATVTVSLGVATQAPQAGEGAQSLVAAADAALYRAKNSGRNRVVEADAPDQAGRKPSIDR